MHARAEGERAFPQSNPEALRVRRLRDAAREDFRTKQGMPLPPHISVEDFFEVGRSCCRAPLSNRWLSPACTACISLLPRQMSRCEGIWRALTLGLLRRCCAEAGGSLRRG